MRYLDEFRDAATARALLERLRRDAHRPVTLMEVCGGQTHTLLRYGIVELLPPAVRLVHGPGCPVCVTGVELIDRARAIASTHGVILASFGDMLRVPGSHGDLLGARAAGADVRLVLSPLDALQLARAHPTREVVFFAVGFETTAPATALALRLAREERLANFSVLAAHVRVPPAIEAILAAPDNEVTALIAAGHVCAVMGFWEYEPLATRFGVPVVVAGFEPLDLLLGITRAVAAHDAGQAGVENLYPRAVTREGNRAAQALIGEVFVVADRPWRGLGVIPQSGLDLAPAYADLDAAARFPLGEITAVESTVCRAGEVLRGRLRPDACPAFASACTPEHPLGAPMVSSEGACAAYVRFAAGRGAGSSR